RAQGPTSQAGFGVWFAVMRRVPVFAVAACAALLVLSAVGSAQQQALTAPADRAAVERGGQLLREQCGFCHGPSARGGSSGPDLPPAPNARDARNRQPDAEVLP